MSCPVRVHLLAIVGEVDAQVHEIIFPPARLVDDSLQHRLIDFVGNIAEHNLGMSVSEQLWSVRAKFTVVRTSIPPRMRLTST